MSVSLKSSVDGWKEACLGDHLGIKHGYAFKGEYFCDEGPFIVLTMGNFFDEGGFKRKEKEKYYCGEISDDYLLREGDLVIAMTEQSHGLLGAPATIPEDDLYLHNQRLGLVVNVDQNALDQRFLSYLFNTHEVRAQIQATANGAKVRHTSPSRICDVEVLLPPFSTQHRIASILSAYDDLIENNLRRIEILEEMAQALYREWFVEFRFPGHEAETIESDVGRTPPGWTMATQPLWLKEEEVPALPSGWTALRTVDACIQLKPGRLYDTKSAGESGAVPILNQSPDGFLGFHDNEPGVLASPDSPVVTFANHTCAMRFMTQPFSCIQNIFPKVGRPGVCDTLYFYFAAQGRTNLAGYKGHHPLFRDALIPIPPETLTRRFSEFAGPLLSEESLLRRVNQVLAETRDLLLPRLISGELDVSELDIDVGDAA